MTTLRTKNNQSEIILAGRCDHDNFGDSLMFSIYASALQEDFDVKVFEATPSFIGRLQQDGLETKSISLSELKSSPENKIFVFVGGGYFGEPEINKRTWNKNFKKGYFFKTSQLLKELNIPYLIQGVEVGPISNKGTIGIVRDLLKNAQHLVVRNKASRTFCEEKLGISTSEYSPDIVLFGASNFLERRSPIDTIEVRNTIALHVTGRLFSKNPLAQMNLNSIIRKIKEKKPNKVTLFFDQAENERKFYEQALKTKAALEESNIETSLERYDGHEQLLRLISESELVITTKLHAGMSAISLNRKVLSISSAPKIKRFYLESGLESAHCSYFFSTPRQKAAALERALKQQAWKIPKNVISDSEGNITQIKNALCKKY